MAENSTDLKRAFKVIQKLEGELESLKQRQIEPIAIVGMSCRFPGADGLEEFWSLLSEGRNAISEVPPDRWDIDRLYDQDPDALGKMCTRQGGFVADVDMFDAAFFNIAPREAALMDPQQRFLLELTWAALENGAIAPDTLEGSATGVFVAITGADYGRMAASDPENLNAYWGTGNAPSVAAGRIAYTFGLTGPCLSIDTACSSSLVAVHCAAESLRRGECTMALVASANLLLAPEATIAFSKARMLSHDGRCRTFDQQANGYVRSEGAAVLVLKTLSRARADGDRVHAIIRGSSVNQDGATGGLTVPSGPSQAALIRQALANAGVSPQAVGYVEAHGTGTALGDPIEVGALGEVFGQSHSSSQPLYIGSVKTLVGHCELAAGMAGLIKLVLSLDRGVIPGYPQLGKLNPHIPWQRLPFAIARETTPWPAPRRIGGISGFGFSGTNAHVVVEAAPSEDTAQTRARLRAQTAQADVPVQPAHLLCLSARSETSLLSLAGRYADYLSHRSTLDIDSICRTAATGRSHLPHRLALAATTAAELAAELAPIATGVRKGLSGVAPVTVPRLAFLFSGQGAQYAGMGQRLYELHPVFRQAIERCEEVFACELDRPLRDLLWGACAGKLSETRYTQPALFAFEYALAQFWLSWGVRPSFVMGHSVGEFAAACLAGIFSLEDGARLVAARGRLMQELPPGGAMAALVAPRGLVASKIAGMTDRVSIAAFNTPAQTVISGARGVVLDICARMSAEYGVADAGLLDVSHAFHSPLMRPMLGAFRKVAESVSFSRPSIGFLSTLTGQLVGDEICSADYWVEHVSAPVDFVAGMASLAGQGTDIALEIGPTTTLTGLARASLGDSPMHRLNSLRRDGDDWKEILAALGRLYVAGASIDWRRAGRLDQPPPARLTLPDYPFERRRYWLPEASGGSILGRAASGARHGHPLLGTPLATAALPANDVLYQSALSARRPGFLNDHRVYDRVVVPAAAYVDMALSAATSLHPELAPGLANLSIQAALVVTQERPTVVQTVVTQGATSGRHGLRIFSNPTGGDDTATVDWRLHVTGEINSAAAQPVAPIDLAGLRGRFTEAGENLDIQDFYEGYTALGLNYGPAFRTVRAITRIPATGEGGESLARVAINTNSELGHLIHPALLDGCFQAVGAIFSDLEGGAAYLPIAIEHLRLLDPIPDTIWSHAVLRKAPESSARVVVDIRLINDDGRVVATVEGLEAVPVDRRALILATANWKDKLYAVDWMLQPRRLAAAEGQEQQSGLAPGGGWLVIADQGGVCAKLADALEARNQQVVRTRANEADGMTKRDWLQLISRQFNSRGLPLAGVVHLGAADAMDTDEPAARAQAEERVCGSTLGLVQALMEIPGQRPPRLWLVTKGAQAVDDQGPAHLVQSMLWGFARTIALEHPGLECTCIDLPAQEGGLPDSLIDDIASPEAEPQIAYRQGRRYLARLRDIKSLQGQGNLVVPDGAFRLRAANYGAFDQLALVDCERVAPADGEIEIEIRAAAINFKDVLFCLGMLREFSERNGIMTAPAQPLGFECAGRVVRVGAHVADLAPGDEVFAMAPSAMASHVTVNRRLVHRKPAGLSFAAAAALPTVFMTAVYSLERLARIQRGDRVLIHACAGGVGQAALQIARRAGAVVYGTASPGKWRVLKDQGVGHVMNSRNLDFADELMQVTGGRGVDIVINSLNGEFIEKSANVLARGGRFIEIGKIGIWSAEQMAAYRPDISYASFDLGEIDDTGGRMQAELLGDVVRAFEAGELEPLPVKIFPITRAEAGFRYLAQASNIGKVVLSVPAPDDAADQVIRPDRSYLVTGGLGALGLEIAGRLVADGARHVILAGRNPNPAAYPPIADMPDGACAHVWPMDVADPASVAAVIARIGRELPPLGGIVHAAGVLDDATIANQNWNQFQRVLAPKVAGAWNLHRATEGMKLRFFVLFSSIASITGAPGQSNYAAANAYLDGLARLRHSQGLPVTCINWGPWDKDGMAERAREANQARFAALGLGRLSVADNLDAFSFLLGSEIPAALVADIKWSRFLPTLPDAGAAALYSLVERSTARATAGEAGMLLKQIKAAAPEARVAMLADALRTQVATVIGLGSPGMIDLDQPLRSLGFDSLMMVELKNRIETGLRCTLNPTSLIDHPTLNKLATYLLDMVFGSGDAVVATAADSRESGIAFAHMTETAIQIDDRRIGLCRWGNATSVPLVVCIHGILDQAAIWDCLADGLCRAGSSVLAPDLRGHGASSHHAAGSKITALDFAMDLGEVLKREATGRRVVLVGHSMGSVVSALYTSLNPDSVAHLVLIEPIMPSRGRQIHKSGDRLAQDLQHLSDMPAQPVYPDLESAARMLALNHPKLSKETVLGLTRRITREVEGGIGWTWDPRMRNWLKFLHGQQDYLAMLSELRVPSTRIYGCASDLAGTTALLAPNLILPQSESFTIDGGHNLHTDATQALLERMIATLKTVSEG
ncbi:MAG: alpha/beta fold hydrolase [Ramlibacter sp.]|nr:alpha/beta fold hydrolase [Ramlibacter sp.]